MIKQVIMRAGPLIFTSQERTQKVVTISACVFHRNLEMEIRSS